MITHGDFGILKLKKKFCIRRVIVKVSMTCTSTRMALWQELGKGLALNLEALHCFCKGINKTLGLYSYMNALMSPSMFSLGPTKKNKYFIPSYMVPNRNPNPSDCSIDLAVFALPEPEPIRLPLNL